MTETTPHERSVTCCIVGCGPAGMMLGFMLARAGVEVLASPMALGVRPVHVRV